MKNIFVVAFAFVSAFAQSQVEEDYLSRDYKYLNDAFEIVISSEAFDSLMSARAGGVVSLSSYDDSLSVILRGEFTRFQDVVKASSQLRYTWERVGYHIWMSAREAKAFAVSIGVDGHPWLLMQALYEAADESSPVSDLIGVVKGKVQAELGKPIDATLSNKELLALSLEVNPERVSRIQKEHLHDCLNAGCSRHH